MKHERAILIKVLVCWCSHAITFYSPPPPHTHLILQPLFIFILLNCLSLWLKPWTIEWEKNGPQTAPDLTQTKAAFNSFKVTAWLLVWSDGDKNGLEENDVRFLIKPQLGHQKLKWTWEETGKKKQQDCGKGIHQKLIQLCRVYFRVCVITYNPVKL